MSVKDSRTKLIAMKKRMLEENINEKGLSVIIPVYDGIEYIERVLKNLLDQEIDDAKHEIIFVFNGVFSRELSLLYSESKYYNSMDITVLINDNKGAGGARNLGAEYAKYSHITFLDIDDYLSLNFIQKNYDYLMDDGIVFSQIHDVIDDEIIKDNSVNSQILNSDENTNLNYSDISRILTITACKTIPRNYLIANTFKEHLKSGEDTVLFTELLVNLRPKIRIIPVDDQVVYYRDIRFNSVSRRENSFEFLINQRIDILEILEPMLKNVGNPEIKNIILAKYNAQIVFMNKYLKENPNEHSRILNTIRYYNFKYFNYKILNRDLADTLIISYCFAPFSDTSASIVIKRILEEQKIVDVVSNNMGLIRSKDASFSNVVKPYISKSKICNARPSFSNFYYLSKFIDEAFLFFAKNEENYKTVYSRAMFPISHFPPLFIKMLNSKIYWKAEFSDPLLVNIESEMRNAIIEDENITELLKSGVLKEFTEFVDDNLFNLVELIPFALADELVFTNKNQLDYMIERFPENLKNIIIKKSTISRHPTLENKYYDLVESNYELDNDFINVAYFGNFYSRRDVKEIIMIKNRLEKDSRCYCKFHVFTNIKNLSEHQRGLLDENNIVVNDMAPYFEFLNLTKKFDVLLVFDSITKGIKSMNPYLPSKISDYLGSGGTILALTEDNSVLSQVESENFFSLDLENISESQFDVREFDEKVLRKKDNFIEKRNNNIIYQKNDIEMIIDNSLKLEKIGKELQTLPSNSPISFNNNYSITVKNNSDNTLSFDVRSLYKQENIIKVITDEVEFGKKAICISKLRQSREYVLRAGEKVVFQLKYNKQYKKPSFLLAGRLRFSFKDTKEL